MNLFIVRLLGKLLRHFANKIEPEYTKVYHALSPHTIAWSEGGTMNTTERDALTYSFKRNPAFDEIIRGALYLEEDNNSHEANG